jgi:hypothetical protein
MVLDPKNTLRHTIVIDHQFEIDLLIFNLPSIILFFNGTYINIKDTKSVRGTRERNRIEPYGKNKKYNRKQTKSEEKE